MHIHHLISRLEGPAWIRINRPYPRRQPVFARLRWAGLKLLSRMSRRIALRDGSYRRIPYPEKSVPGFCIECDVKSGRLHVPGCTQERCPRCGGKLYSCGCR